MNIFVGLSILIGWGLWAGDLPVDSLGLAIILKEML